MFRKPRSSQDSPATATAIKGRAPSPSPPAKTPFTLSTPPSVPRPTNAKSSMAVKSGRVGGISQGVPNGGGRKRGGGLLGGNGNGGQGEKKPNGSILSFFKKAADESIFIEEKGGGSVELHSPYFAAEGEDVVGIYEGQEARFNEVGSSYKRRKMSDDVVATATAAGPSKEVTGIEEAGEERTDGRNAGPDAQPLRKSGPFLEDSDTEHEDEQPEAIINVKQEPQDVSATMEAVPSCFAPDDTSGGTETQAIDSRQNLSPRSNLKQIPSLIKEETSCGPSGGFADFEGMDDFDEDIFEEGDEFMERRYMEEQARLEAEESEKDCDDNSATDMRQSAPRAMDNASTCPICSISFSEVNEQEAAVHVNDCLDGKPSPLPQRKQQFTLLATKVKSEPTEADSRGTASPSQYKRPFRPPKPGEANPFALGHAEGPATEGSAFKKLMSGHSEEAAWAEAAASENASRGKPSYQRTCPFYKILPGLSICVDAFRYGAVQGCNAYFLSHFHSDHYIGLTSNWSHGPIFCSKVTANLVRQQLRVNPQYVVPLEWEQKVEVPGTKGVHVAMISANHCPGSSLFLFEKLVGKHRDGSPKLQRVLHCGDFRACRMHIEHPLLKPEVQDAISGGTKEQKLDVCYLDTTYLNPKYAFPNQELVIKACADMCVSLSKCTPDDDDGWEQMKRQRAGEGMAKFVQRENSIKSEPRDENEDEDAKDKDGMKIERNPHAQASQQILSLDTSAKTRGRLLVVVGTYSIGKERICLGIAKALNSLIYAPPSKQRIVAALEDPEIDARMTNDPRKAQVHMTPLFEIRAETLDDYLKDYFPHFTRAVGFRPSGWNYRPPNSRFTDSPSVQTVLYSDNWKSTYSMKELVPQRGSTGRASCFGVPYSEHSSFRELTMFCTALRIDKIIPTVNVGSAKSREKMKMWCERWGAERRKNGLYKLPEDGSF
ncbi:DRMBL-domain-containing protein [Polychaeton citri CBS 116435]|uniref:DRMBL-domain-containing protein n=1 Tax=Polychaeton citri CBS 116435 TaxID=1314669 RepID=A0A9P4QC30_9PEZI|nr:DRMBL-domain-containing protein [Polychaeton citri CBS 116435]